MTEVSISVQTSVPNSRAEYSFVVVRTEGWELQELIGRDGNKYRVEGYVLDKDGNNACPLEECHGFCCKLFPLIGPVGLACEHQAEDGLCALHAKGGASCKPISCLMWPQKQLDIDVLNRHGEKVGGFCPLRVVEVTDG